MRGGPSSQRQKMEEEVPSLEKVTRIQVVSFHTWVSQPPSGVAETSVA